MIHRGEKDITERCRPACLFLYFPANKEKPCRKSLSAGTEGFKLNENQKLTIKVERL